MIRAQPGPQTLRLPAQGIDHTGGLHGVRIDTPARIRNRRDPQALKKGARILPSKRTDHIHRPGSIIAPGIERRICQITAPIPREQQFFANTGIAFKYGHRHRKF